MSNEDLDIAVMTVLTNALNFPERVHSRILGQDMRPLGNRIVAAVEAALASRESTPDTEWEYACRDETKTERNGELYNVGQPWYIARGEAKAWGDTLLCRRKAGPWLPVDAVQGDPVREGVKALTGASDAELDELGGFAGDTAPQEPNRHDNGWNKTTNTEGST